MDDPTDELAELDALAERMAQQMAATEPGVDRTLTAQTSNGDPAPLRVFDPGSLIVGGWFLLVGLVAAVLGSDRLNDVPPVVIPISFVIVGLAPMLPRRPRDPR